MSPDVIKLFQTMLSQHGGNATNALLDLCHRYLWAMESFSAGYARMGMNDTGADVSFDPPPVADDGAWIATGREAR